MNSFRKLIYLFIFNYVSLSFNFKFGMDKRLMYTAKYVHEDPVFLSIFHFLSDTISIIKDEPQRNKLQGALLNFEHYLECPSQAIKMEKHILQQLKKAFFSLVQITLWIINTNIGMHININRNRQLIIIDQLYYAQAVVVESEFLMQNIFNLEDQHIFLNKRKSINEQKQRICRVIKHNYAIIQQDYKETQELLKNYLQYINEIDIDKSGYLYHYSEDKPIIVKTLGICSVFFFIFITILISIHTLLCSEYYDELINPITVNE